MQLLQYTVIDSTLTHIPHLFSFIKSNFGSDFSRSLFDLDLQDYNF